MPELDVRLIDSREADWMRGRGAFALHGELGDVFVSPELLPLDARTAVRADDPDARTAVSADAPDVRAEAIDSQHGPASKSTAPVVRLGLSRAFFGVPQITVDGIVRPHL